MPRFFIYNTEAGERSEIEKNVLRSQFAIMMKRLWYGITWPSAILTLIFGGWIWYLYPGTPGWLKIKLIFVLGLYLYHFSLHMIFRQEMRGIFKYSSQQLRMWNEVPTVILVAVVILVVVKQNIGLVWGLAGLFLFILLLMTAIKIYKLFREKK